MPHQEDIIFNDFDITFDNYDTDNYKLQAPSFLDILKRQESDEQFQNQFDANLHFEDPDFTSQKKKEEQIQNFVHFKNVQITDDESGDQFEIKNTEIQFNKNPSETTVKLVDIISGIEKKLGFSLKKFMLFITNPQSNINIFVQQNNNDTKVDYNAFKYLDSIKIRIKQNSQYKQEKEIIIDNNTNYTNSEENNIDFLLENNTNTNNENENTLQSLYPQEENSSNNKKQQQQQTIQHNNQQQKKRVRERSIQDVIDKVQTWRQLFRDGVKDTNSNDPYQYRRLTLAQAAEYVGLSKKSLDNYYLQIKRGQKLGFNFAKHADDKIGKLRQFNKKNLKLQQKNDKQTILNNSFDIDNLENVQIQNSVINQQQQKKEEEQQFQEQQQFNCNSEQCQQIQGYSEGLQQQQQQQKQSEYSNFLQQYQQQQEDQDFFINECIDDNDSQEKQSLDLNVNYNIDNFCRNSNNMMFEQQKQSQNNYENCNPFNFQNEQINNNNINGLDNNYEQFDLFQLQ